MAIGPTLGAGAYFGNSFGWSLNAGRTNASDIYQTKGYTNIFGGSYGGPSGWGPGAEYAWVPGPEGYEGLNVSLGKSQPLIPGHLPVEGHLFNEHTWFWASFSAMTIVNIFIDNPSVEVDIYYHWLLVDSDEREEIERNYCPRQ